MDTHELTFADLRAPVVTPQANPRHTAATLSIPMPQDDRYARTEEPCFYPAPSREAARNTPRQVSLGEPQVPVHPAPPNPLLEHSMMVVRPGAEIVLLEDENGNATKYVVRYDCYLMTYEQAAEYISSLGEWSSVSS